ncbi:MAG: FliH/SctL family protein, partial [Vicinamibacterales bacterium]
MSSRVVRIPDQAQVERFTYGAPDESSRTTIVTPPAVARNAQVMVGGRTVPGTPGLSHADPAPRPHHAEPGPPPPPAPGPDSLAALGEREAFAQGYAQGERAGLEMATRQLAALRERLGRTLDELASLREDLTYRTERQVVDLALAVAARILHREVSLDRELLLVMARIAIDRLGDVTTATVRLHPEDEAAARGGRDGWPGGSVSIVADPSIRPGACLIQTSQGVLEVGVDAQLKELATALLGDGPAPPTGTGHA